MGFLWAGIGTFYLLLLSIQDFRNNMMIDDRKNYLMMGLSLGLIYFFPQPIYYILALLVIVFLLTWFLKKLQVFGVGDLHSLAWVFYGFGIVNIVALIYFCVFLVILTLFYELLKNYLFKHPGRWPFMYVILIDFVMVCLWFGLYSMGVLSSIL